LGLLLPALASAQAAAAPAAPEAPSGDEVERLLAEVDAAWPVRDAPGGFEAIKAKLDVAEKLAPNAYGVLWRISRWYWWAADDTKLPEAEKSRLGKLGWDYGDRAAQADPRKVEGWFYASAGVGNYSLAMGVVSALLKGMEGKYTERLSKAEQIDAKFESGAIDTSWGRFHYELPWPKYDPAKSEIRYQMALGRNKRNVRARVYLAELYLKEDHPKEARAQLEKAIAEPPGGYDAAEERRYQAVARELLAKMK
jgi:hypothetical protein